MNPQDQPAQSGQNPQQYNPANPQASGQQPQTQQPQPQQQAGDGQPQVVYMARPLEAPKPVMTPEVQQRHEASKQQFPKLNLSEGEYVISVVRRHPIGLVSIWGSTLAVILAIVALVAVLEAAAKSSNADMGGISFSPMILLIPAILISSLALLFGWVASTVYKANNFVLTNESVIQHIQTSLFNMREQTISLANIEDASYAQDGIIPQMFNYGSIRLSTIGDEDTYRFHYTSHPREEIAVLNNAVENFKNGRRVGD